MKILVCGAYGFIGRHLTAALEQAGHQVVRGGRQLHQTDLRQDLTRNLTQNLTQPAPHIAIDYTQDTSSELWEKRLRTLGKIEIVINAVGILNQSAQARFAEIHRDAPVALFDAAQRCGVKGIVQISALGASAALADDPSAPAYMQTKHAADAHLMQACCAYLIVRPSLVVGMDGESSRLFRTLASLPVIALPGNGQQQLQPVHIDDLCQAILNWLADPARRSKVLDAVGPQAISYRQMLATYRAAMGLAPPLYLPIPMSAMRLTAKIATLLPQKVLAPDTLRMLEQDNVGQVSGFAAQLGYPPRGSSAWFAGIPSGMLAAEALASWIRPLLRLTLALIWLITGLLSLGIYPLQSSLALLAALGLHGSAATTLLFAAATLDIVMALASLFKPGRVLWLLQIVLILAYTLIISVFLPEFLLHPFGPILKNLAILALLLNLLAGEKVEGQLK